MGRLGHSHKKPQLFFRDVVRLAILDFLDGGDDDGGSDGCMAADAALLPAGLWTQASALYSLYTEWRSRFRLSVADFLVAAANGAARDGPRENHHFRSTRVPESNT